MNDDERQKECDEEHERYAYRESRGQRIDHPAAVLRLGGRKGRVRGRLKGRSKKEEVELSVSAELARFGLSIAENASRNRTDMKMLARGATER